ncbi:UNVERIFIED_CONTAM: hypothetical protein Slati_2646300 [Sesamum latifolium]|uniref:Uncharacterized protein n=1 Tax=Sesamum latifolium TaxID=2727402 RepID=A0AAW2VUJ7_9LAMI
MALFWKEELPWVLVGWLVTLLALALCGFQSDSTGKAQHFWQRLLQQGKQLFWHDEDHGVE